MADEILPGLWLGSVCAARNPDFLLEHNITVAYSVAREWPEVGTEGNTTFAHLSGLGDSDQEDAASVKHLFGIGARFVADVRASNRSIIVYCNMGISRSSSVVLAYVMGIGVDAAMVRAKRPVVRPNGLYQHILNDMEAAQKREDEKSEL